MSDVMVNPAEVASEASVESKYAEAALREIRKNCFLLSITVRRWDGKYQIPGANSQVEHREIANDLVTKPCWKLVPGEWHKQIQPYVSGIRAAIYKVGVPFKEGVYIVPRTKARELLHQVESIRRDYKALATQFCDAWPGILGALKNKICSELGEHQWLVLEKKIPDQDNLESLFDVEVALWPIGGSGSELPIGMLDRLEILKEMLPEAELTLQSESAPSALSELVTEVRKLLECSETGVGRIASESIDIWMSEANETTARLVGKAVEGMLREPVQEFAEAVQNLENLQDREGVCRSGTLDAIRRAYDKLIGFQFMVPDELAAKLKQVEVRLGQVSPRDVNTRSALAGNLTRSLREISKELSSEEAIANGLGQFTRHLDL